MNMDSINENKENEFFQPAEVLRFFRKNWKFLAIGIVLCAVGAYLYLRYSTDYYSSEATVLVKEDENIVVASDLRIQNKQNLFLQRMVEREVEVLKSRSLIESVTKKLELQKEIFCSAGRTGIKKIELYKESPFWVDVVDGDSAIYDKNIAFEVKILAENRFKIQYKGKEQKVDGNIPFTLAGTSLLLTPTDFYREHQKSKTYEVKIRPIKSVVSSVRGKLKIDEGKSEIGMLKISIEGLSILKNNEIIDELINQHEKFALEDKRRVGENTRAFLEKRLRLMESKLDSIEQEAKALQTKHEIVTVVPEVASVLTQLRDLETDLLETGVKKGLVEQMNAFVNQNDGFENLIPINVDFVNPELANIVGEYNDLIIERNDLLANSSAENPRAKRMLSSLSKLNNSLRTSLNSLDIATKERYNEINRKIRESEAKKRDIPWYQLKYRAIMREQKIRESIYLLLLRRKEENEINIAAMEGSILVIDYAYSSGASIFPNKKKVYLICFALGILIPVLILYIRQLFNTKLRDLNDLKGYKLLPIVEIPYVKNKEELFFETNSNSLSSEVFRMLRTNLTFRLKKEKTNVIMVTSTVSGEGKTFVTLNLAKAFADTGKKVLIVELELRAPKVMDTLNLESKKGISDYISNPKITREEITYTMSKNERLSIIPAGTLPSNPSELLLQPRVESLFNELRKDYDLLVVDTSPVGLVTDTVSIAYLTDLTLYVARANRLERKQLKIPKLMKDEKKLPEMEMILNGVELENSEQGYGYGYSTGKSKKNWLNQVIFRKK